MFTNSERSQPVKNLKDANKVLSIPPFPNKKNKKNFFHMRRPKVIEIKTFPFAHRNGYRIYVWIL